MNGPSWLSRADKWAEPLLAAAVVASTCWSIYHLLAFGYLPQPFFYEPSDTWMDWFNTAYWAHQPGAYDSWGTIYPPLSFVILKFTTFGPCYASAEGVASRDCDWFGAVSLHAIYIANCVLTWKTFRKIDTRTAIPRTIALSVGLPMAYGLERGNIILFAFTFMLLAFGPLVKSARLRWLFAALAINLKVYLIGSIFAKLLGRRWRWFEGAVVATVLVYLVTYAILGAGTPLEIYENIMTFSSGWQAASLLDLWYATTYKPVISLLEGDGFPIVEAIGSRMAEVGLIAIPALIHLVQGTIVLAAAAAWFRSEVVPQYRLVFLSVAIALISVEPGGYAQILLIMFVFMEPWRGVGRKWAIVAAYLLCIAADIRIDDVPPVTRFSFLGGQQIVTEYFVGIGPFVRPLLVLSLPFALSLVTIRDVWADMRENGWAKGSSSRQSASTIPA